MKDEDTIEQVLDSEAFQQKMRSLACSRGLDLDELIKRAAENLAHYLKRPFEGEIQESDLEDEVQPQLPSRRIEP